MAGIGYNPINPKGVKEKRCKKLTLIGFSD